MIHALIVAGIVVGVVLLLAFLVVLGLAAFSILFAIRWSER